MDQKLDRQQLQLAMVLKYHSLKNTDGLNITFDELEEIFYTLIWKTKMPTSLSEAIQVIFALSAKECIDYVMYLADQKSFYTTLEEYQDLY